MLIFCKITSLKAIHNKTYNPVKSFISSFLH